MAVILLILCVAAVLIGLAGLTAIRSSLGMAAERQQGMGADEFPALRETWSFGEGDTKVVSIPIRGMIMLEEESDGLFSTISATQMALLSIRRATHDHAVRAIILQVDSGGGGITASDVIYKALMDFKESDPNRRVVAVLGDVAASGAYYIALAADAIVAHPTTITGSIGVLIQTFNVRALGDKIGVKDITIKSGRNKDILNPLGEFSDEQRLLLQGLVDELHSRFVGLVSENRHLSLDAVRRLADGRIYSASTAKDLGLIDQIGYWEDGVDRTAELLDVDTVKVYRYESSFSFSSFFQSLQHWNPVADLVNRGSQPRLLYLWTL